MIKMTGNEQEKLVRDTKKEASWIPGFRRRRAHEEEMDKNKEEVEEDGGFVLTQSGDYL